MDAPLHVRVWLCVCVYACARVCVRAHARAGIHVVRAREITKVVCLLIIGMSPPNLITFQSAADSWGVEEGAIEVSEGAMASLRHNISVDVAALGEEGRLAINVCILY